MSVKESKKKEFEIVAPDGGWGYMVGLGVILNLATLMGFINCFGMLFKDLFIKINMDTTSVTIFNGVGSLSVAIAGFIAGPLQKFMSLRQVGLAAALMFNLGGLCTVFVKSKLLFIISQGLIQGLGNGIIYSLSCTMLNNYFVKRRLLAFSLTQTFMAVFSLFSPHFVKWSIETYGPQGTLLLVSAISMHNIFGMAVMQPVAWHMKKVEIQKPKEKAVFSLFSPHFVKWSIETYGPQGTLLLVSAISMHNIFGMAVMQPVAWHMKKVEIQKPKEKEMKLLLKDTKEIEANKNNLTDPYKSGKSEHNIDDKHDCQIKFLFSQFIDYSLMKSFVLSNACIGVAFSGFLDLTFVMLLPQALYAKGWNESEVATALSLGALGDLVARIGVILMNNIFKKIGSHETFVAGLVITFGSRIGMLWSDNHISILIFLTITGVSRCVISMFTPVVVADSVGQEKFTSAIGMVLCIFGLSNCTVGPVIGVIRDLTDSYPTAFYVITSCFGIIVISWSIELLYKKKMRNKIPKINASLKT